MHVNYIKREAKLNHDWNYGAISQSNIFVDEYQNPKFFVFDFADSSSYTNYGWFEFLA